MMSGMIYKPYILGEYIVGMWKKHLASQLLWRVEPKRDKEKYLYPSTRQGKYRSPTFSWASADAEKDGGGGITYGEITDMDILIQVKDIKLTHVTDDEFGLVKEGYILLKGVLKKI